MPRIVADFERKSLKNFDNLISKGSDTGELFQVFSILKRIGLTNIWTISIYLYDESGKSRLAWLKYSKFTCIN